MAARIRVSPSRWVLLAAISLPLAELAIFVALVLKIGLLATLALMLATTALGIFLLRHAGRGQIAQIRVGPDGLAGAGGGSAVFVALGGIFLVLPGFLTDAVGLALLLPPVQRALRSALGRIFKEPSRDDVVDLAPDEWRETDAPPPPPPDQLPPPDERPPLHEQPKP